MLYLTTRDNREAFTAYRALTEDVAQDNGLYIPMRLPKFERSFLSEFSGKSTCEIMAYILNQFFSADLQATDISCCIGNTPLELSESGRKTYIAEAWHNPGRSYEYAVTSISNRLMFPLKASVSSWTRIAVGIAYMFCVYAELCRDGLIGKNRCFDVCVPDDDFSLAIAALYAKKMGISIGKIVVSAGDNSAIWDLINHGQMITGLLDSNQKLTMERLIYCVLGQEEARSYAAACDRKGVYTIPLEMTGLLPENMFGSVVGAERIRSTIERLFNTHGYLLSDNSALCYAGLQDYRAKTGQGSVAVLFGSVRPESD